MAISMVQNGGPLVTLSLCHSPSVVYRLGYHDV